VGKNFGAFVAYCFDLCHPDRVRAIVSLGIPYMKPGDYGSNWDLTPGGFHMKLWQEPGRGLADFGRFDVKTVIRNLYTLFSKSELPMAEDGKEIMDLYDSSIPLPPWFTEHDLQMYSSLYEKSGFVYPMQVPFLCSRRGPGRLAHYRDCPIQAPCLLIMGTKDCFRKFPGMDYIINSEMLKPAVPNLEINFFLEGSHPSVPNLKIKFFPEGCHFIQEQFPEEVNKLIIRFLNQHL